MIIKPKKTTLNDPLIHFKRYSVDKIGEIIKDYDTVYRTSYTNANSQPVIQYWKFNKDSKEFVEVEYSELTPLEIDTITDFVWTSNNPLVYVYSDGANAYYVTYGLNTMSWNEDDYATLEALEETYNTYKKMEQATYTAKTYAMPKNVYYNNGTLDYVISGSIDETVGQPMKGLMVQVATMTIRIDAENEVQEEDLLVIDGRLYIVESEELSQKKMPRPLNIKYFTIHNIV